jgi:hypothetical protein
VPERARLCRSARSGGRTWWAHLAFTRMNIQLTIPKNQVEELMNVRGIGEKSFLKLKPLITVSADKGDRASGQK